jgi:predicted N-acetyltransferase YhbS
MSGDVLHVAQPTTPATPLRLEARSVLGTLADPGHAVPSWLAQLRSFRARVLWDSGRRPTFRAPAGDFVDPDEIDLCAYHLIMRESADSADGHDGALDGVDGAVVACLRSSPLERLQQSRVRELDPTGAARLLAERQLTDEDVLEGGRLVVDPRWQKSGLAAQLIVAEIALARLLERRLIWGVAGTRGGQSKLFDRFGRSPITGEHIHVAEFDDDVVTMAGGPDRVTADLEQQIADATRELGPFVAAPQHGHA